MEELGDYQIGRLLAEGPISRTYEAEQVSVARTVMLVRLRPELAEDESAVQRFLENVRAKANLKVGGLAPVFEAHRVAGGVFYTFERLPGKSLAAWDAAQEFLSARQGLTVLAEAAAAMGKLESAGVAHTPLEPEHVYLSEEGEVRLMNLAASGEQEMEERLASIQRLAESVLNLLSSQDPATPLVQSRFVELLQAEEVAGLTWARFQELVAQVRGELRARPSETKRLRSERIQQERKRLKLRKQIRGYGFLFLLLVGCVVGGNAVLGYFNREKPKEPSIQATFLPVAGGEFVFGEGERATVRSFWVAQHEVTIGQYAEFLEQAAEFPETMGAYAHRDEPEDKGSYQPEDWEAIYQAAFFGASYEGVALSPDYPVFGVDFWDAFAYAAWAQGRLPTVEEWERVARGEAGRRYPWGDEAVEGLANLKNEEGGVDEVEFWSPVDAFAGDRSPAGAIGMAGNVAEWTATWGPSGQDPESEVPQIKGGSFADPLESAGLWEVDSSKPPGARELYLGFRMVRDEAP
ncbi:MAG: SUMF1/EgtB/PvdO family nonheme iron enzyme [Verrucomicrobiota bacterium]